MIVSVIIPTYKRVTETKNLLDMIQRQDMAPYEILVVDDTPSRQIETLCHDCKEGLANKGCELVARAKPQILVTRRQVFLEEAYNLIQGACRSVLETFTIYRQRLLCLCASSF